MRMLLSATLFLCFVFTLPSVSFALTCSRGVLKEIKPDGIEVTTENGSDRQLKRYKNLHIDSNLKAGQTIEVITDEAYQTAYRVSASGTCTKVEVDAFVDALKKEAHLNPTGKPPHH